MSVGSIPKNKGILIIFNKKTLKFCFIWYIIIWVFVCLKNNPWRLIYEI